MDYINRKENWNKCYNYSTKNVYSFDWGLHRNDSERISRPMDNQSNQRRLNDSLLLYTKSENWKITYTTPEGRSNLELEFDNLAKKWKLETGIFSIDRDRINDTFLDIISLGKDIIPFILKDMQKPMGTARWHIALKVLAKTNPIKNDDLNKSNIIKEEWIKWGKENNII